MGSLSGRRLGTVAAQTLSWSAFARRYPRGDVLVPPRRSAADYGRNPYLGYDRPSSAPHLFAGPLDRRLRPKERVVALPSPRPSVAVPFARLARDPALELDAGTIPVVVLFDPRVASAIDADSVAHSRQVGTAAAFERRVRGRPLTFDPRGGAFVDRETRSRLGRHGPGGRGQAARGAPSPPAPAPGVLVRGGGARAVVAGGRGEVTRLDRLVGRRLRLPPPAPPRATARP